MGEQADDIRDRLARLAASLTAAGHPDYAAEAASILAVLPPMRPLHWNPPFRWKDEQIVALIRRYPAEGSTKLAREYGITQHAVRVRASKLGIRRTVDG